MFKKLFLYFSLFFILISCGEVEQIAPATSGLILKETSNFSISIPSSWDLITDNNKTLPKPSNGYISLAATSKNIVDGFANNILILSTELKKVSSSSDFSILNNIGAEKDYLNYRKLDSREFIFSDGEKSKLYIFEAKYNFDTPKLKFLQTAYICKGTGAYFFTIALAPSVRNTSKYEAFLKTFTCK